MRDVDIAIGRVMARVARKWERFMMQLCIKQLLMSTAK
jgi:hypothetical protein